MKIAKKNIKLSLLLLLLVIITLPVMAELQVHYIDVGQGDAILIQTADNKNMLIDAGDRYSSVAKKMVSYLEELGIEKIDIIVGTHPHADHIGGIPAIINNFEVGKIYDSGRVHTSTTYEEYLLLIYEKDIPFYTPRAGDEINLGELSFSVIHPDEENLEAYSLNDASIVLHLEYGDVSFLFTGDIELKAEEKILEAGLNIRSDILKVAHHGSSTSSHEEFIDRVMPEVAIIQVGEDNRFDHPAAEVLQSLLDRGIEVYRNDLHGDIVLITDGSEYSIQTSKDMDTKAAPVIEESASDKININTASARELQELNGIGPALSERIVRYREEIGLFETIEDIMNVNGIGEGTFSNIKDDITVSKSSNVKTSEDLSKNLNINTASSHQLQSLWGVGPVIAERVIEYRNRKGSFDTIEEIMYVDGIDEIKFNRWKNSITI
ncbi:helix-hairpin-helix domain-containing protein [Natronospora cellulosivora (SeqCode)]